jgi:hypothetical protein
MNLVVQDNEVEKAVIYVDKEFEHLFVSDVKNGPNAQSYNIADIKGITAHAVIETRLLIDTGRKVIEIQVSSLKIRDFLVRCLGGLFAMEKDKIRSKIASNNNEPKSQVPLVRDSLVPGNEFKSDKVREDFRILMVHLTFHSSILSS